MLELQKDVLSLMSYYLAIIFAIFFGLVLFTGKRSFFGYNDKT